MGHVWVRFEAKSEQIEKRTRHVGSGMSRHFEGKGGRKKDTYSICLGP